MADLSAAESIANSGNTVSDGGASPKPWLAHYPAGVPHDIDLDGLESLADLFRRAVRDFADRPAFESFGKSISFRETEHAAERVAAWLQAQGLKRGDRVALMMPNVLAYPAALFGVLVGGFTVVNVNPLYTPRELAHQMNDSGAKAIIVLENFAHVVAEAMPDMAQLRHVVIATPGDLLGLKGLIVNLVSRHVKKAVKPFSIAGATPFAAVLKHGGAFAPVQVGLDDIAFLQYTGGTTGVSKGATLTHRNVSANVAQCQAWFSPTLARHSGQQTMVTALPLYHIFALTCCCLFMVKIGACCLLIANPRDIPGFVKTLKTRRFTMMSGVNTLYNALANNPEIKGVDFSTLIFAVAGGMATQAAVAKTWKALTGVPICEGYGLSETSPVVCVNSPQIAEFTGTIGYPVPATEVDIRDEEGAKLAQGETGELCVRGPQVMAGYWQRPDETAKVMTPDGFFRTGDVALMTPDGQVKIVDRKKDMILVSGFNVYPNEVEDVMVSHPGVLEVAVIGLPDEHSGEAVTAYVVRRDSALTADDLRAYCRDMLTGYKVPKQIFFRETLPKTNVGKVLRRVLREEAMNGKS